MNSLSITNTELTVKELKGQRVVTFRDVDKVHQRKPGTASSNFKSNRKHFINGEDYFVVKPSDIQIGEFPLSEINNRGTTLLTETGYLMLVKSFTDDLAWTVQRELVNNYFRVKQEEENQSLVLNVRRYRNLKVMTIKDLVDLTGTNKSTISWQIRNNPEMIEDVHYFLLKGESLHHYNRHNDIKDSNGSLYVITEEGALKLAEIFGWAELIQAFRAYLGVKDERVNCFNDGNDRQRRYHLLRYYFESLSETNQNNALIGLHEMFLGQTNIAVKVKSMINNF